METDDARSKKARTDTAAATDDIQVGRSYLFKHGQAAAADNAATVRFTVTQRWATDPDDTSTTACVPRALERITNTTICDGSADPGREGWA